MDEIKVSICCATYNHEKYIRQALDSFLMQKTNFKYEILIHDDASTDGTVDIIREYEHKHSDVIKPIYQTENQYSQGVKVSWKYQYPRAKGKYIALCEGDDFWCDENKLQEQYDALESSGAVFCAHQVRYVSESGEMTDMKKTNATNDYYQSGNEFLQYMLKGNICPFQTSSYMFEREAVADECNQLPEFIRVASVGDTFLMMLLATKGNVCYLNREMSCYRMFSVSSWTLDQVKNKTQRIQHKQQVIKAFEEFNIYTNYNYEKLICSLINRKKIELMKLGEQYDELLKPPFLEIIKKMPIKEQLYILCSAKVPKLMKFYKSLKAKLRKG